MEGNLQAPCWTFFFLLLNVIHEVTLQTVHPSVSLTPTNNGITLVLSQSGTEKLVGTIGTGQDFSTASCIGLPNCTIGDIVLDIASINDGYEITWTTDSLTKEFTDCFDLRTGDINWYGGPERWSQQWPIEKLNISGDEAYIIKRSDNFAIAERYWLNSLGVYIYLDERVPLFVDQNIKNEGKVCFTAKASDPYVNRTRVILKYAIIALDNAKVAHLNAVNNYLGKPKGYPDENMIRQPIWTTWAKYKTNINDTVILQFAQNILDNGFQDGQIEIDDDWERCYGAQEFKSDQFAQIADTVSSLKEMGFRVALWVHPFVNSDCEDISTNGINSDFFVKNTTGQSLGSWWDGDSAYQIDFTNQEAANWYSARLKKLQESPGIDTFKFDAGETGYAPQPSVYPNVDQELIPNVLTESYIRTCAKFGKLIEARSAWRTQDLPMFTRMIDKDSTWTLDNGLASLITTLLQMNMNGYPFVLPDMIGGNGYSSEFPTVELIIRWTQANTFMPAMQFSFLPWDIDTETDSAAIVKKYVDLHNEYSDVIINALKASVENGTPVNPPIWWMDPNDTVALRTDDEYMLGESILVAPIIREGEYYRNIYLPKGKWYDINMNITWNGPIALNNYPVPLDSLAYFVKQP